MRRASATAPTACCAVGADIPARGRALVKRAPPRRSPCSAPLSQPLVGCPVMHRNRARLQRAQQQARASETDIDTVGQGSLQALDTASASNDARAWRDDQPPGPEMPFGLLLALAAAGTAETAYLTLSKLFNAPVACPIEGGCDSVLNSDYAQLFGIPLSAFGLATYLAVAGLAWTGVQVRSKGSSARGSVLRLGTLGGATVLATTSSWLMFILFTKFPGDSCTWCLTSALLSLSILVTATRGFSGSELREVAVPGGGFAAALLLSLALIFSDVDAPATDLFDLPYSAPVVGTTSPPRAVELAKRLKAAGAKMYGAFWCSHCFEQKEAFGREAMKDFPYVECYPDGFRKEAKVNPACTAAGLDGFPTWVIGNEKLSGEQTFDKLEAALERS